jgi:hypothetical protein
MLLVLAGCARAQQSPATAERIQELSHAWAQYYAKAYQVPTALVEAIIDQESAWNPYAVSQKGAAGLMQLMPTNWKKRNSCGKRNGISKARSYQRTAFISSGWRLRGHKPRGRSR